MLALDDILLEGLLQIACNIDDSSLGNADKITTTKIKYLWKNV